MSLLGEPTLTSLTAKDWERLQKEDPTIGKLRYYKENGKQPNKAEKEHASEELNLALHEWGKLCFRKGVLYRSRHTRDGREYFQLVLPSSHRSAALVGAHDETGHLGQDRTLDLLRARFYWPHMSSDVKSKVLSCRRCACRKDPLR
ncbi:uncharacterized protein LOC144349494 [Saccoglossus kowalevskii]